jgi:hypothetical protein
MVIGKKAPLCFHVKRNWQWQLVNGHAVPAPGSTRSTGRCYRTGTSAPVAGATLIGRWYLYRISPMNPECSIFPSSIITMPFYPNSTMITLITFTTISRGNYSLREVLFGVANPQGALIWNWLQTGKLSLRVSSLSLCPSIMR